jgi:hypothetical protein
MSTQGSTERRAVLVSVTGRVQGVSYRAWTRDEARRLGLGGWVCNESDGSVRALVVGPPRPHGIGETLTNCPWDVQHNSCMQATDRSVSS